ncbi:hypothetical protein DNU06_16820 [Putridiphycobacter roseus]|uniref:Secretion system C-terminal sorting domain-containing protein n=1 Tax=Putridiphycobacter roseus TaxID=2219161 RepID=A0A2W1MUA2_9FLAO|nr:hypothetical protein DNU06_16820 [Putridiphycobacter roseus]
MSQNRNNKTKEPVYLAPHTSFNGTYTFHCDTAVANYKNGAMKAVIRKALEDWTCLTGIDWKMGTDTAFTNTVSGIDSVCIIRFSVPTDSMASNTVASASLTHLNYSPAGTPLLSFGKEIDIKLNSNFDFFCDTTGLPVPSNQRDLYTAILHELGHGHGLNHVIDTDAIMHFQYSGVKNDLVNDLSANDGGDYIMFRSTLLTSAQLLTKGSSKINYVTCATNGIFEIENGKLDALVYPNPFNNEVNIQLNIDWHTNVTVNLYNVNKQLIKTRDYTVSNGANLLIIETEGLPKGIYVLNLSTPEAQIFKNQKIVK